MSELKPLKDDKSGRRVVRVTLADDEEIFVISKDSHYKLGGQVDEVVASHVLLEAQFTYWCSVSQDWV